MEYKDFSGQEIKEGCYIVYAALDGGQSAQLRYGLVRRLKNREILGHETIPTLGIISVDLTYDNKWELQKNGKEITLSFTHKVLVVYPNQVPNDVQILLNP